MTVLNSRSHLDRAKLSIAPGSKPEDWIGTASSPNISVDILGGFVKIDERLFHDNVARVPGSSFKDDGHGDCLPRTPTVLTGLLDEWPAFYRPGISWNVQDLASRTAATTATTTTTTTTTASRVSLDGGPSFARMSMCSGKATMKEYQQYCENDADGDSAPLYVFDPDILTSAFVAHHDDGSGNGMEDKSSSLMVSDAFSTPACFSNDAMGCINGTEYRPLPPAWLLVGVTRSGTPIHNHPLTVAWNALLVGCKLWCCLPPDVDESLLLLNLDDESDDDFDLSAIDWFQQCRQKLPDQAKIIVQRPGEVVFLPPAWFHVVLNIETSTAISVSLTLPRDLESALSLLIQSDKEFAAFWVDRLLKENMYKHIVDRMDLNLQELKESQELLFDGTEKILVVL
jgi:histone arginine demethylase JMJD6